VRLCGTGWECRAGSGHCLRVQSGALTAVCAEVAEKRLQHQWPCSGAALSSREREEDTRRNPYLPASQRRCRPALDATPKSLGCSNLVRFACGMVPCASPFCPRSSPCCPLRPFISSYASSDQRLQPHALNFASERMKTKKKLILDLWVGAAKAPAGGNLQDADSRRAVPRPGGRLWVPDWDAVARRSIQHLHVSLSDTECRF